MKLSLVVLGLVGAVVLLACSDDAADPSVSSSDAGDGGAPDADASADATPTEASTPFDGAAPAIECAVSPCIKKLVAGPTHYCAIASDGVVRCWGNPAPLGGFAAAGDRGATPVVLSGLSGILDIAGSTLQTCAITSDGAVRCFGQDLPTPTPIDGVTGAKTLAIGEERSCAVVAGGGLTCWGDSPGTGKGTGPVPLTGAKAAAVTITAPAGFAVAEDGALLSWGNDAFMLGRDTALDVDWTPAPVQGLDRALQVAASDRHVCAVTVAGHLFCWGHDENGTLGIGSIRSVSAPTEVFFVGPEQPAQVAVALTHSCARMTDRSLYCWARVNTSGELGYAALTGVFIPTKVGVMKPVAAVATGIGSTCTLSTDGSVQCWGDNAYGQLGLGHRDLDRHAVPTTVVFP